nr:MAG TPA: hypothetical protein [Caudoviricetes sp.]
MVLPSESIYILFPSVSLKSKLVYYGIKKPHSLVAADSSHIFLKLKQL